MKSFILTAFTAVCVVAGSAEQKPPQTWYTTIVAEPSATSWREIAYGSVAVTPVPSSTALVLATSYHHEPLASRNINVTTISEVTKTLPLTTMTPTSVKILTELPRITVNDTTTETTYLVTTIATVTLSTLVLPNGSPPASTVTIYTGTYQPVPGQEIISRPQTAWPTSVIWHETITDMYRVFTYTGSTSTVTEYQTKTVYRTTATASTTATEEYYPDCPRFHHGSAYYCTSVIHAHTVMQTRADAKLAYVTATRTIPARSIPTVTYAAKCAPSNLISSAARDARGNAYGVGVELSPDDFTFPGDFNGTLIGIPPRLVPGAAACCQLCVDSRGCAASEFTVTWEVACRLFYRVPEYSSKKDRAREVAGEDLCGTRGQVPVQYYANVYALPGQEGYIQTGCGSLKYLGLKDPFCSSCCPSCEDG